MKQTTKGVKAFACMLFVILACVLIPLQAQAAKVSKVKFSKSQTTVYKGGTTTLTTTISPSSEKNRKVNFKAGNSSIVSLKKTASNKVEVTGKRTGTTTITATVDGTSIKSTCKVTVKISNASAKKVAISPTSVSIYEGHTKTLKASISPSYAKTKTVKWSSSNTKVATVDSKGKVRGKKAGTAIITAKVDGTNVKATRKVTVKSRSIKLVSSATVYSDSSKELDAAAVPSSDKLVWSSSNTKVATVNSKGRVYGKKAGTVTITAKISGTSIKKTCKVTVKNPSIRLSVSSGTVDVGSTKALKATLSPSSRTATWTSSNTKIATVNSKGVVTGKKAGTATITAKMSGTDIKKTCKITVKNVAAKSVKLSETSSSVYVGSTKRLTVTVCPANATNKEISWSSSNTAVAAVSTAGNITGKKAGTATITATVEGTKIKATCKVTVKEKAATATQLADKFYHTWKGSQYSAMIENRITKTHMYINGESSGSTYTITKSLVKADGSIWVYTTVKKPTQYILFKIAPDGKTMKSSYSHDNGKTYSKTEYTFKKVK